jgi:hypothetical protein
MSVANELLLLLLRLEVAAGDDACEKFMAGKISVRGPGSGRYASSYTDPAIGSVVVGLLEQLLRGEVTPILDVDSYYRNGKRWPIGMQLVNGKLIDVWPPGTTVNYNK